MRRTFLIRLIFSISLAVMGISFTDTRSATATTWYTGNRQTTSTGVKATISTPTGQPAMTAGVQASWVSLPCCNWVQTGWAFYKGWSTAQKYVEHNVNGVYGIEWYGTQSWGSTINYQVSRNSGSSNYWGAYINGFYEGSWGPFSSSSEVQALSEVQDSSSNQLSTTFTNVYYRNLSNQWLLFNQANWQVDAPYKVNKYQYYYYLNWGP